jgi:diguanylate cyclase (GGDEF)-like protein/PAS domain S-box-containing protein
MKLGKIDNKFFQTVILENLNDSVVIINQYRQISYWNKSAERLTGYKSCEAIGKSCNLLAYVNEEGKDVCHESCLISKANINRAICESEVYIRHYDGHWIPVLLRIIPIQNQRGKKVGMVEILRDSSQKVALLQQIERLTEETLLDSLTGLGNRRAAEITLQTKLSESQRYGWSFGLQFIDIDHFKRINDEYGHDVGDSFLKIIARTLLDNSRLFDFLGRWGGEEFIIINPNVTKSQLVALANRYKMLIEKSSLTVGSAHLQTTISIGVTLAHSDDTTDSLVKRADQLMYQCKTSGRNSIMVDLD